MIRARRPLRQHPDIWPGFVDALSTLLMVIIFLLVVFVLAQFFFNQLLQGKDTQLQSLEQAVAQLTDQLNLEQSSNAQLRLSVTQLSSDLQSALADATTPRRSSPTSRPSGIGSATRSCCSRTRRRC